jgi:hypothetical protein
MKDKFEKLFSACQCTITLNDHHSYYQPLEEKIKEIQSIHKGVLTEEIISGIIKNDRLIEIQCYPRTPIGFFVVAHYDIEEALRLTIERLQD